MGEEQTQYGVLIITALVALGAMFVMGMHTTSTQVASAQQSPDSSLVGAATTNPLPAYSKMDYNADGVLDGEDSELLADSIAVGDCPDARVCDVDANGVLDERDLARFNGLLSEPIAPRAQQDQQPAAPATTGNAISREPLVDLYDGEYPSGSTLA